MAKLIFKDKSEIAILNDSYIGDIVAKVSTFDDVVKISNCITKDDGDNIKELSIIFDDETKLDYTNMTVTTSTLNSVDVKKDGIYVELSFRQITDTEKELYEAQKDIETIRDYLTDEQALTVKDIYDTWEELIGQTVPIGTRFTYNEKLYRVIQDNLLIQEQYIPGKGTESLYTVINEKNAGTLEDPIPWETNMQPEVGKYYIEGNLIAKCIEDPKQPLYHPLSALCPGRYFEKVENKQ